MRKLFAVKWLRKITLLGPQNISAFERDEEDLATSIADKTDGWSFAFLKELCVSRHSNSLAVDLNLCKSFVSFLLSLAHDKSTAVSQNKAVKQADEILFKQLEILSSQIFKLSDEQEAKRKEKKEADGQDSWCPPTESDTTFVHLGANF